MELTEFWTLCSANGIVLDKEQLDSFTRYIGELLLWNKQVNLISRKDEENVIVHHIIHSLTALKFVNLKPKARCLDVGTGGGLPGIPITIANPAIHMLMVDSVVKKIKMTSMFAKHTGIRTLQAMAVRAEDLQKQDQYQKHFDFVFSRAVTRIDKIYSWVYKLMKPDGKLVLYKGGDCSEEIAMATETYPGLAVEVKPIKFIGIDWFEQNEKSIVICSHKARN